jgi:hypothetical protein
MRVQACQFGFELNPTPGKFNSTPYTLGMSMNAGGKAKDQGDWNYSQSFLPPKRSTTPQQSKSRYDKVTAPKNTIRASATRMNMNGDSSRAKY